MSKTSSHAQKNRYLCKFNFLNNERHLMKDGRHQVYRIQSTRSWSSLDCLLSIASSPSDHINKDIRFYSSLVNAT